MVSLVNSNKILRKKYYQFYTNAFRKWRGKEIFLNSFDEDRLLRQQNHHRKRKQQISITHRGNARDKILAN